MKQRRRELDRDSQSWLQRVAEAELDRRDHAKKNFKKCNRGSQISVYIIERELNHRKDDIALKPAQSTPSGAKQATEQFVTDCIVPHAVISAADAVFYVRFTFFLNRLNSEVFDIPELL